MNSALDRLCTVVVFLPYSFLIRQQRGNFFVYEEVDAPVSMHMIRLEWSLIVGCQDFVIVPTAAMGSVDRMLFMSDIGEEAY